jgi:hypothetical protein
MTATRDRTVRIRPTVDLRGARIGYIRGIMETL